MNTLTLAILLQLTGVVVVIAEIIIPSGGFISIIAILLFGYSLFLVFQDISSSVGMVFIGADIVLIPILILVGLKLMARSPAMLKKELSRSEGVVSQAAKLNEYLGREGIAACDLHPAGSVIINGEKVDVVSRGEYIEKGSAVVVHKVTGNQIIVRKKETAI
jgi:membrane-bound ClpP family serine protease